MKSFGLVNYALLVGVAAAMLAGCGGFATTSAVPSASVVQSIAQNRSVGPYASALGPPERSSAPPLYKAATPLIFVVNFITSSGLGNVVVYDPKTNDPNPIAVIIAGIDQPNGDCVDGSGTLYVASGPGSGSGWVSDYSIGKTKPSMTITDGIDGPANCTIDSKGDLWVTNSGGSVKVTSCILAKASDSTDGSPIVNIDAQLIAGHGNTNSQLIDITLTDCTVFNMAPTPPAGQYGLEIQGGQNIKVIGGTYSNNSPNEGAGIAITGACGDVQIIGVNLQPSYPGSPNLNSQQYALLVSGSTAGTVLVSGCDMTGYSFLPLGGLPVHVTAAPYRLYVDNCMGYNDVGAALNATSLQLTTGVYAAELANPYFGPSVLIYSNSSPVTLNIFGQAITSTFGIIYVPNPYDMFYFSGGVVPSSFSWIGK
jgi:hypothetical protein